MYLGRGNYLSYDPELWINPAVQPFHYEPFEEVPQSTPIAQTVVKGDNGEPVLIQNDDYTSFFLQRLRGCFITRVNSPDVMPGDFC